MRIVHFQWADNWPGAAREVYRLHRSLLAAGADSLMVVGYKMTNDPSVFGPEGVLENARFTGAMRMEFWAKQLINGTVRRVFRHPYPLGPETSLGIAGSGLVRKIPRLAPDVVQLSWIAGGLVRPPGLNVLSRFPLVWRVEDLWPVSGFAHYESAGLPKQTAETSAPMKAVAALDRALLRRKKNAVRKLPNLTVLAPSRWIADVIGRSEILGNRRIEVIPATIDTGLYRPIPTDVARRTFDLSPESKLILFGAVNGTANKRKGFDLLIRGLHALADTNQGGDIRLVVFGGNTEPDERIPWPTVSVGRITDEKTMACLYSACDVFVNPVREEALGQTPIEATACGTPVVAFNVGGLPDVITHRTTGYLAEPFDVLDLARGIDWVINSPQQGLALREAARSRAVTTFAEDVIADRLMALYSELAH